MELVGRSVKPKPKVRPPSPPPTISNKRGQTFTLGSFLGQGGFARCYEVHDGHGMVCAVKVVHKPSLKTTKQRSKVVCLLSKLLSEIKIHQLLTHPHIVKFLHVFEDQTNVYMLLELCELGVTFIIFIIRHS
jgi:cell cycle serine/threonine-protein kinase CDC5/MSD2